MATLTETAYYTRKIINWMILGFIAYIILRFSWGIFMHVWLSYFPQKSPPPNHRFGKIPSLVFPNPTASPSAQFTYRLETIEGSVPRASESATVYFMPKNPANLLALSNTQQFAKRLNFTGDPIQETKYIYRFEDPEMSLRYIRYDIVSKNFILRYVFEKDTTLFSERGSLSADALKAEAKSFLQTYGLYPEDIAKGTVVTQPLKYNVDTLIPTTSISQADAIRINFFRSRIAGSPIFTPYPDEAPIAFIYSGSKHSKKRLLQVAYTYWPIDSQTTATYALKPSATAWEELQAGKGYIARYPKTGSQIVIRKVYIGYYDSFEPQTYLQPVFVFEGDNGFLAYVTALDAEWIE